MSDENNMSEFEMFYHSNNELFRKIFPEDFTKCYEKFIELADFHYNVFLKYLDEAKPLLLNLASKQIFNFKTVRNHPDVIQFLDDICSTNCSAMMYTLAKLIREFKEDINIYEKYPNIERWREFYGKPQKTYELSGEDRKYHTELNDEEWEKYKDKENRSLLKYHIWKEKRKTEYFDIVQPLIFKYLPELNNIEGDHWVIYAATVKDLYEEWKILCEEIETIIEYQMPPESVKLKSEDFQKLVYEYFLLRGRVVADNRSARIDAECENL
jgi:hypothetical protein